jgi:HK97 family phage portal protein
MGLLVSLFRRSLENPSTPLSAPDDWLFDSLGSFRASSGVNVNRETALTLDVFWRCVSLISGDVSRLPLYVYKRTDAGKEIDEGHPAYPLLAEDACDEISALDFKRVLTLHALTEGNGYAYIIRDRAGRPKELWPLSPMKTYPVRANGRLWYVTQIGSGAEGEDRKLPSEDVFHLKGLSFDGLVGYNAVAKMREALGLALAHENFGSIFFRNQATPKVVLKHPGRLKPEAIANLRESWERMHSGLENSHRTAILQEGVDIATLTINARDSQLIESKAFSRIQICNFFGVPPHKVGDSSRTSYNSLEQENEAYVDDGGGLGYWLPAWQTEARRKLLSDGEKAARSHCIEHNTRQLLRANLTARTQYYTQMLAAGVLNPNEVREEEGYNPRDGGDDYMVPLNMQKAPPEGLPDPEPPTAAGEKPEKTQEKPDAGEDRALAGVYGKLVADATRRMVRRIGKHAQRAAKNPADFMAWLDKFEGEHRSIIAEALYPAWHAATGREESGPLAVDRLLADLRADLSNLADDATPKTLESRVSQLVANWARDWPGYFAEIATQERLAWKNQKTAA